MTSSTSHVSPCQLARSKPIAIKHNDHHFFEDQEDLEHSEKQFYECATWRMYNRIVDHRIHSPPQRAAAHINHAGAGCSPTHVDTNNRYSPQPHHQHQVQQLIRPKPRYARAAPIMPMFEQRQQQSPFTIAGLSAAYDDDDEIMNHQFDGEVFELEL